MGGGVANEPSVLMTQRRDRSPVAMQDVCVGRGIGVAVTIVGAAQMPCKVIHGSDQQVTGRGLWCCAALRWVWGAIGFERLLGW